MQYEKGKHCTFYHRYHLVWITKYRYEVLTQQVGLRGREIIRQVCEQKDINIIRGVVSKDHVHRVPRSGRLQEGNATCCM